MSDGHKTVTRHRQPEHLAADSGAFASPLNPRVTMIAPRPVYSSRESSPVTLVSAKAGKVNESMAA
jgi:hypothetical protein